MFRRSGYRFADKNMRQSITARAWPDSEGTGYALAAAEDRAPIAAAARLVPAGEDGVAPPPIARLAGRIVTPRVEIEPDDGVAGTVPRARVRAQACGPTRSERTHRNSRYFFSLNSVSTACMTGVS